VTRLAAPPASVPSSPSPSPQQWTVLEVIRWTAARFSERGLSTPRLDAELIVAHVLALPRVQLYVQFDRPLSATELPDIRALIKRRQAGESVAYLVGKKEFWGFEFAVDARVLVPRPDTETLVEEARARLEGAEAPRIADVGTGSGALAVTLAKLRPDATVFASDISAAALEIARGNAERLGAAVTFVEGDLATPLAAHAPFSLIVANLPYIPSAELAALPAEVRAEPKLALDGGDDGLGLVRRLVEAAPALLSSGGTLALEIGAGQAPATATLLTAAGLVEVRARPDLAGIDRVVAGRKP
jgi:release factor glutamine methyltransferase